MPLFKPRTLSPRGIVAQVLPHYFRTPRHAQQMLPGDTRSVKVPLDADEIFNRIKFKEKKSLQHTMLWYEAQVQGIRAKKSTWCVASGRFAPRDQMSNTRIFPKALGTQLMEFICSFWDLWSPENGLMLPRPTRRALEDGALLIVPDRVRLLGVKKDYKFCVVDSSHPDISAPLFKDVAKQGLPNLTTAQLDGEPLQFGNHHRPKEIFLYTLSCLYVWKKTYLDHPECDDKADFAARFVSNISKYWPPLYVKRSHVTNVFLLKYNDHYPPGVDPPPITLELNDDGTAASAVAEQLRKLATSPRSATPAK